MGELQRPPPPSDDPNSANNATELDRLCTDNNLWE